MNVARSFAAGRWKAPLAGLLPVVPFTVIEERFGLLRGLVQTGWLNSLI